jgi:hypothetical protein
MSCLYVKWSSFGRSSLAVGPLPRLLPSQKLSLAVLAFLNELANAQTIACPQCGQSYRLSYSDSEWHRVKDWLKIADSALRRDHAARHEAAAIPLEWRGIRKG